MFQAPLPVSSIIKRHWPLEFFIESSLAVNEFYLKIGMVKSIPKMNSKHLSFHFEKTRDDVEIHLPDGKVVTGPRGAKIEDFFKFIQDQEDAPVVGAVVDGDLRELTFPVIKDAVVRPITMADADGSKIYRRSLTLLLETAFEDLFPDRELTIDYSVPSGGYFCKVSGQSQLSQVELDQLLNKMKAIVSEDSPLIKTQVTLNEAIKYFKAKSKLDKIRLLKYRKKPYLILYSLKNHRDYHHGYMVPSSGYLKWFDLVHKDMGFILQYPRRKTPTKLLKMPEYSKLIEIFDQYGEWLINLGIDSVGSLNDAIHDGSVREIVLVSEALHEQKIAQIAAKIKERATEIKVILIAGPSSSGKTTFSKRLAIQLLSMGISPFALEMDNYFIDRDQTPKDENGQLDFESFAAIDKTLLQTQLKGLVEGDEIQLPKYNFQSGKREVGDLVKLDKEKIVIIEGIHGLNPELLPNFPPSSTFRIYISCLTQLNLDRYNRISTTDTRMLRRIVRDAHSRGFSAQRTINMWESVRRGERQYIYPFQENADQIFNSALVYELSVLKPYAESLLRLIPHGTMEYLEAKRLLATLEWFLTIDDKLVPDNSILREFIGGSILSDFKLWGNASDTYS